MTSYTRKSTRKNKSRVLSYLLKHWHDNRKPATKLAASIGTGLTEWEVYHAVGLLIDDGSVVKKRLGRFIAYQPTKDLGLPGSQDAPAAQPPADGGSSGDGWSQPAPGDEPKCFPEDEQPAAQFSPEVLEYMDDDENTQRVIDAVAKACIEKDMWVGLSNFIGLGGGFGSGSVDLVGTQIGPGMKVTSSTGRFHQPAGHRS